MNELYVIRLKITSIHSNPILIKTTFMKQILFIFLIAFILNPAFAQNTACEVLLDSLKGSYEGECNKGKADGTGKAVGTDSYVGEFRNGLPDGKGKYSWKNGSYYEGNWRKGMKDGQGELHSIENKKLTVLVGFWKKDKYKGEFENPYRLVDMGTSITYKNVQNLGARNNSVYFSMKTGAMGVANTDNFQVLNGYYQRTNTSEMVSIKTIEFQDVQFPFRVRFNGVDRGIVDIEFFQSGEWRVEIVY